MKTENGTGSLYTRINKGIAEVEFGHPASNSFPAALLDRLRKELTTLSEDDEVRVILLRSEGNKAFCAGASFQELLAIDDPEKGKAFFSGFAQVINAIRSSKKLVIGRIHGKTVGGGVGLAAACDYCFATEHAAIRLSEISIGIGPFVIAPAIERKMGVGALAELTLAAHEWKNAYWAKEKGLYARVFEETVEMDRELEFFCERLASYNPAALTQMKKVLWEGTENWPELLEERASISGELVLSEATREALSRF